MIILRKSEQRLQIKTKNQTAWRTFDWENESDSLQNGFDRLKILNEDLLSPGTELTLHNHQPMVIVTYVQEGVMIYGGPLEKCDLLEPGFFHRVNIDVNAQNHKFKTILSGYAHIFQAGFAPDSVRLEPGGRKKFFTHVNRKGILRLIASPDGKDDSIPIQPDIHMYSSFIHAGNDVIHKLKPHGNAWLHIVKGRGQLNHFQLQTGDGAGFSDERILSFAAQEPTEILLFDLGERVTQKAFMEKRKIAALSNTR